MIRTNVFQHVNFNLFSGWNYSHNEEYHKVWRQGMTKYTKMQSSRNICKSPQEGPVTTSPFLGGSLLWRRWHSWRTCRRRCSSCRRNRRSRSWRRNPWMRNLQVASKAHCQRFSSEVKSRMKRRLLSDCCLNHSESLQTDFGPKMLSQTRVPRDVVVWAALPDLVGFPQRSQLSRLRCPLLNFSS